MKAPKDWKEVTVDQYYNLQEVYDMDWSDKLDKAVAMLSALTMISIETLEEKTPIRELSQGLRDISFIGKERPKVDVIPRIRLNGKRYEFDLIFRDSVAGSFIDFSELSKNPNKNIHKILAIFLHEIDWMGRRKPKTVKSQKEIAKQIQDHMTMDVAFSYSGFFLSSLEKLQAATLGYLEKKKKETKKTLSKELETVLHS